MSVEVEFLLNKASEAEVAGHLKACDANFVPPLNERANINNYTRKIVSKSTRFEAWSNGELVGLVAVYCNDQKNLIAYITSVSVLKKWTGKGIATCLISRCIVHAKTSGMRQIDLEVANDNTAVIRLYKKSGFVVGITKAPIVTLSLYLKSGENHDQKA